MQSLPKRARSRSPSRVSTESEKSVEIQKLRRKISSLHGSLDDKVKSFDCVCLSLDRDESLTQQAGVWQETVKCVQDSQDLKDPHPAIVEVSDHRHVPVAETVVITLSGQQSFVNLMLFPFETLPWAR